MRISRDAVFDRLARDWGIILPEAVTFAEDEWGRDFNLAMDAQPSLVTTASSGIPAFLTTLVDPKLIKILVAPNKLATIFGEAKKGVWTDKTAMFPVAERTGYVSSYGDYSQAGRAGVNVVFENRQAYLYQAIIEYGEYEMDVMGIAKISWAAAQKESAVVSLNKFQNLSYAFGISGLANYGLLNDPALSAPLTPSTKADPSLGTKWINGGVYATPNEVYNDVQAIVQQLINQTFGLIDDETDMKLVVPATIQTALNSTNAFGVTVRKLISDNFPNMKFETNPLNGAVSAANPQGVTGGNLVQLIATSVEGEDTGYCSFNEKLRAHPIIRDMSSFKQKHTQGTWGAIIRMPIGIAQMIGV